MTDTDSASPFHPGERTVQARLGVEDIEDWARQVVRPYLPAQHRAFYTGLPFMIAAARDAEDRPWATLLAGPEGFVSSPDPTTLRLSTQPAAGDALAHSFGVGAPLGLLGIELETRRRNRANGRIVSTAGDVLAFALDQSFGNCPQYIRERAWRRVDDNQPAPAMRGRRLTDTQIDWIERADTFFIASGYRGDDAARFNGMDASHRGGAPGFVQVLDDARLRFPDYAGNNHFNTIGNLAVDPRAGLLFVDFVTGSLLQLTGRTTIDWDSPEVAKVPGARRLITFEVEAVVELPSAVALRWDAAADSVRTLRLIEKTPESRDITSFVFEARDGGALPPFEAGQHLPVVLDVPELRESVERTYSLSGPPSGERYRITVKREPEGLASRFLHDALEAGAFVNARAPAGDLHLPDGDGPVVLISAGVGITPMASMLHAIAGSGAERPVWFLHGARDGAHHALADEIRGLASGRPHIRLHVAYSRPRPEDRIGRDYDRAGRIDAEVAAEYAWIPGAQYYLCGPTAFMADVQQALEQHGVGAERIHTESFGPAG